MGNILGEPFKKYVDKQIKKRQEIHGKVDRTTEEISYLNSTNAWVKLASGVSLTQKRLDLLKNEYGNPLVTTISEGKELAMKNVLFNGVTSFNEISSEDKFQQQQRTGFLGPNGAYGMGGNDFGIVPMPGIVSMDSQDLNRGSIKKTRVKLKAYNKNQFDVLDVLYLRLGYTVLLEFGNNRYWDSGDEIKQGTNTLTSMGPTLIDQEFFEVDDDYYNLLLKIEKLRREKRGNYDAILGKIQNFSWTFAPDGTYDIDLDIISIGDVIESLKVNLPPFNQDPNTTKDKQIVRNQFKDNRANNIDELDQIYPGITAELTKWYNDAATTNTINIKYTLGPLPNIRGSKQDENRNYDNLKAEGSRSIPLTNKDFKPSRLIPSGTISVFNVPTKTDIGTVDLLGDNNLDYYLKEAVKFAIIMKVNGYYGGNGFANPLDGILFEKEPDKEKQEEQNSPWKLDTNGNPIKKKNVGETLITARERFQSIVGRGLTYSNDNNKTTEGLVGTNSMPSNIPVIRGFYKINNIKDSTSFQNDIPSLKNAILETATFKTEGNGDEKVQPYVRPSFIAPTANISAKTKNINYNNSDKRELGPISRHSALHLLLLRHMEGENFGYAPSELDATDLTFPKNLQEQFFIVNQHNLLKNLPLDEFLRLVLIFFQEVGAAGGAEDNQFSDDPEYASFSQELEYEKSRNRIYGWFYKIRKFYTGIQTDNNPEVNLQAGEQEALKIKFGDVKMEHRLSSTNSNTARNIGFIINPTRVDEVYDAEQKRKQQEKEEKNEIKDLYDPDNLLPEQLRPKDDETSLPTVTPFKTGDKANLYENWNKKVGYPNYRGTIYEKIDVIVLDKTKDTGQFDLDPRYKFFVRLGTLLKFVQDKIIPQIIPNNGKRKVPLIKIDTDSSSNICYAIDNMMSSDIRSCIIRNEKVYTQTGFAKLFVGPSGQGLENFFPPSKVGEYTYGRPMNVYMNFEFIQTTLDALVGNSGEAALFDFLKKICNEINKCLGYVNNLEPTIDYETNTIKIIDQTPIPGIEEIAAVLKNDNGRKAYRNFSIENPAVLEVYGYNPTNKQSNFVHNIGLTTGISKRYAAMITIGATANGSVPGSEATAFSKWNLGVEDRVKPKIIDPESNDGQLTLDEQNRGVIQSYVKTIVNSDFSTNFYKLIQLNSKGALEPEYVKANGAAIENFYKYAQAKSSQSGSLESSVGFLPFNLQVDMEGLSGIKIYNRVHVDTRFLPSNYPQTLDFIVTKVNHKVQDNNWDTTLETQATRILKKDNEGNIINTPNLLGNDAIQEYVEEAVNSVVKTYSQTQRDLAVTPPDQYTGTNGNLPDSELKSLSEINFPNEKLATEGGAADNFIKMWKAMQAKGIKLPTTMGSYRPYTTQYNIFDIDLFISTGGTKDNRGKGVVKAKKGSGGGTAAAYPGTSNHGWGKAVDIGGTDKRFQKMRCFIRENGATYGWGWTEGQSIDEPWHFTYYGFDSAGKSLVNDSGYKGKSPCK